MIRCPNGVGSLGYTVQTYDSNINYLHTTCYINTDFNDTSTVRVVVRRELERALGLQSFSPDPNSDMDENSPDYANTLSHDDGLVLAVKYSLNNWLPMDPYIDSVVSSIDTLAPSGASFKVSPDSISEYNGGVGVTGTPATDPNGFELSYLWNFKGEGVDTNFTTNTKNFKFNTGNSIKPSQKYILTCTPTDGITKGQPDMYNNIH